MIRHFDVALDDQEDITSCTSCYTTIAYHDKLQCLLPS